MTRRERYLKAFNATKQLCDQLVELTDGYEVNYYDDSEPKGTFRIKFGHEQADDLLDTLEEIVGESRVVVHLAGPRDNVDLTFASYSFLDVDVLVQDINNVEILYHTHDDYASVIVTGNWY